MLQNKNDIYFRGQKFRNKKKRIK